MADIVERLRRSNEPKARLDAADEIERLRQQLAECQRAIQRLLLCDMAEVRAIEGSPGAMANARAVLAAMQGDNHD